LGSDVRRVYRDFSMDQGRIVTALNQQKCPDCGADKLLVEPCIDVAENLKCRGCGAGFFVTPRRPGAKVVMRQ
jgi:ribosomal protein S27AE